MLESDMGANLDAFFLWSKAGDPSQIGYPTCTPTRRLLGGGIGCAGLSDAEAEQISRALAALRQEDAEAYHLVLRVHRDRKTLRWLESRGRGDRKRNGRVLAGAHQFVRGFLARAAA